jgi:hypothetical protein
MDEHKIYSGKFRQLLHVLIDSFGLRLLCPNLAPRNGASRCAIRKAPRQLPLSNPPNWAKLKPGVSLTLDKSWV